MIPDLSVDTVEQVGTRDIRQGDAFQLIEQIDDASVDLIITSPPYWGHRTYGLEHNWNILREWEEEHTRWEPRLGSGIGTTVASWALSRSRNGMSKILFPFFLEPYEN